MTMTATRFLAQYKHLKAHVDAGAASPELRAAWQRLVDMFRTSYSSETLKDALAADLPIASELEERITSALVLYRRERTLVSSRVEAEPPGS